MFEFLFLLHFTKMLVEQIEAKSCLNIIFVFGCDGRAGVGLLGDSRAGRSGLRVLLAVAAA